MEKWENTKGPLWTIKRIKLIRLIVYRWISGNPLPKQPYLSYCGDIPRCLPFKSKILVRDKRAIRLVLTVLSYSRWIVKYPDPDYSSIVEPTTYTNDKLGLELGKLYKELIGRRLDTQWSQYHRTSSKGPNGLALVSSLRDAQLLGSNLIEDISLLGGENLRNKLSSVRSILLDKIITYQNLHKKNFLRRISLVKDIEGKLRVIAIFDYWSQCALKPLHDSIFRVLKGIKTDCTYNQNNFNFTGSDSYFSLDLSKATDRFPLRIQVDF